MELAPSAEIAIVAYLFVFFGSVAVWAWLLVAHVRKNRRPATCDAGMSDEPQSRSWRWWLTPSLLLLLLTALITLNVAYHAGWLESPGKLPPHRR